MKLVIVLCLLVTGISAFGARSGPRSRNEVNSIVAEALERIKRIGKWLPFHKTYSDQDKIRTEYDTLEEDLAKAITLQNAQEQKAAVETALLNFRKIGLILPFHEITAKARDGQGDGRDGIVGRYLIAEDLLSAAVLALAEIAPTSSKIWTYKGLQMKWIGKSNVADAIRRCPDEFPLEQKGHLITADANELTAVWRDMRDPKINTAFGEAAAEFTKVWTSTKKPSQENRAAFIDDPYYYFDFKNNVSDTQAGDALYEAICAAALPPRR